MRDPDAIGAEGDSCWRRAAGRDSQDYAEDIGVVAVDHTRTGAEEPEDIRDGCSTGSRHAHHEQHEHHCLGNVVGKGDCGVHTQDD